MTTFATAHDNHLPWLGCDGCGLTFSVPPEYRDPNPVVMHARVIGPHAKVCTGMVMADVTVDYSAEIPVRKVKVKKAPRVKIPKAPKPVRVTQKQVEQVASFILKLLK